MSLQAAGILQVCRETGHAENGVNCVEGKIMSYQIRMFWKIMKPTVQSQVVFGISSFLACIVRKVQWNRLNVTDFGTLTWHFKNDQNRVKK